MAEFLVKASGHWMDDYTQDQINALSPSDLIAFNARVQSGDIIVVRDDGWEWGARECPPDFIVIQCPDIALEDAQQYEGALYDNTDLEHPVLLKCFQYSMPPDAVNAGLTGKSSGNFKNGGTLQDPGTPGILPLDGTTFTDNVIKKAM